MKGRSPLRRDGAPGSSLRRRTILLSILPVLFLGATYFLLVEFGVRESYEGTRVTPLLRIGGGAIVLLFLAVALGIGILIADQLRRPIRMILKAAEGGGQEGLREPDPRISEDPDTRRLLLKVQNLAQQNRAGARALVEIEALRRDEPRIRLTDRLREDIQAIDARLEQLGGMLGNGGNAEASPAGEVEVSLEALERLATVWSLRVEKARRDIPELPGELGSCFQDFSDALERLRDSLRGERRGKVTLMEDARSEIAGLHETIAGWLKDEKGATQ